MNLNDAEIGEEYEVAFLHGGKGLTHGIRTMGIHVGSKIKVIARQPLGGPITVRVDDKFDVSIGRWRAEKIEIE